MTFDFDRVINRRATNAAKWDLADEDTIPLWVADMDFASPPAVVEALQDRVDHGVFGYPLPTDAYYEAFLDWERSALGSEIQREWVVHCSAVMPAVKTAILACSDPGDAVVVQPPIYKPFFLSVTENDRRLVRNPLRLDGRRYTMDIPHLRRVVKEEQPKILLLCSPHNPVGRVWTAAELGELADICVEHGVVVVADEIHCGLVFDEHRFVPFAEISPRAAQICVACHSPSKTFNIAGLPTSQIVIPNGDLRRRFKTVLAGLGHGSSGVLSLLAAEVAYREGEPWRRAMMDYIDGNRRWLASYVEREIPGASMLPLEGTFIPWIDFREAHESLGLDPAEFSRLLRDSANVWLHEGPWFGREGAGFQRVNIACPRSMLEEAMSRVARTVARRSP